MDISGMFLRSQGFVFMSASLQARVTLSSHWKPKYSNITVIFKYSVFFKNFLSFSPDSETDQWEEDTRRHSYLLVRYC